MSKLLELFRKNLDFYINIKASSQADLAREIGMDPGNLNRYIKGKTGPQLEKLEPMAVALGIQPYELIKEINEDDIPKVAIEIYRGTIKMQAKQIDVLVSQLQEARGQLNQLRLGPIKSDYETNSSPSTTIHNRPPKPKK